MVKNPTGKMLRSSTRLGIDNDEGENCTKRTKETSTSRQHPRWEGDFLEVEGRQLIRCTSTPRDARMMVCSIKIHLQLALEFLFWKSSSIPPSNPPLKANSKICSASKFEEQPQLVASASPYLAII
ncbi:uncharacterized protein LOC117188843 [Drosophila miranda]|uniref:uncharacterized protein LOC117188843 n=1 Tax=Drosophila miranda TaxID=7229 RepID=UPI00143F3BAC|nr:uncharacterized protein LOC117188843 [Drosophila miranda]